MKRIKAIKPKRDLIQQAMDTRQSITCPACQEPIVIKLKELLATTFTCPKCKVIVAVKHQ